MGWGRGWTISRLVMGLGEGEGRAYASIMLDAFLDYGTDLELALEGGGHF